MSGRSLHVVAGGIGREQAEAVIGRAAPGWTPKAETRLYYPYFWYLFRYRARTLFGTSALPVSCLVDARTGLGATTDPFTLDRIDAGADPVLTRRCTEEEARRIAERYTGYVTRRRRKALVAPHAEVIRRSVVHKPFWIVSCTRGEEPRFRVLVDGITGDFHPLAVSPPAGTR